MAEAFEVLKFGFTIGLLVGFVLEFIVDMLFFQLKKKDAREQIQVGLKDAAIENRFRLIENKPTGVWAGIKLW